jgi:hypothetical protein
MGARKLSEKEIEEILDKEHTVSVTISGDDYLDLMTFASRQDTSVEDYVKKLIDVHRRAVLVELAEARGETGNKPTTPPENIN